VRGSIPTPGPSTVFYGGNTSCIEVRSDGQIIVLDAGTGIRPLGLALAKEFEDTPLDITLLITHTHWDHIQGFPFFLPAYKAENKLRILGYEGARSGLAHTLKGQMESPYFPIALQEMPGNIVIEELRDLNFRIGRVPVDACFVNHPGIAVGYRLNTAAGSVAYLPDNEPFGRHVHHAGSSLAKPEDAVDQHTINFIRDADILIIDAQFDENEYNQHIGWGHGCVNDVVRLALAADVRRVFLFHHDPNHDDDYVTKMLGLARELVARSGKQLIVDAAREGEEVVLRSTATVRSN
jgi:phosphoribosyl 1,2-cyclic phosphodiesterase